MSPDSPYLHALLKTLRETIQSAGKIHVFGWREKNHDEMTLAFERSGLVVFTRVRPFSASFRDYWLLTEQSNKATQHSLQSKGARVSSFILRTNIIKRLLSQITDLLPQKEQKKAEPVREAIESAAIKRREEVRMPPTVPDRKVRVTSRQTAKPPFTEAESGFVAAFFKAVGENPEGTLTRVAAAKITRIHFGPKANPSHLKSLLKGLKKEGGKRIGSYKLSERALDLITSPEIEPIDRIEKLHWLISRRTSLLKEREEVIARSEGAITELDKKRLEVTVVRDELLAKIDRELTRANEAEKLLSKVDEL